jgi:hypothetical protein
LAVAAALVIFAREIRLLSVVDDLLEEEVEFSRLGSCPSDPKDLVDGASDLNDALLMLAGLGGKELASEWLGMSKTLTEACGVQSFWGSFSDWIISRDDIED